MNLYIVIVVLYIIKQAHSNTNHNNTKPIVLQIINYNSISNPYFTSIILNNKKVRLIIDTGS